MIVVFNLNSLNSLIRRSLILKAVASLGQNHRRAIIAPFSKMANTTEGQKDVFQLAEKSRGQTHVAVNVGSFNMGIHQSMLHAVPWRKKHGDNFQRVITKAITTTSLHVLSCCEVGGHLQGFKKRERMFSSWSMKCWPVLKQWQCRTT